LLHRSGCGLEVLDRVTDRLQRIGLNHHDDATHHATGPVA
jgi:hypothetical protein